VNHRTMKRILIAAAATLIAAGANAQKTPGITVTRDGQEIVSADYEDPVEYLSQKLPTFGKQTVAIEIEIPVKVAPKWRRYYVANFVSKYASTLNKLIDDQMQFAVLSDKPNEKLADTWESQLIVVPSEFEDLPDDAKPKAAELVHNQRTVSWQYRASKLAEKHFKALKAKIGSAE